MRQTSRIALALLTALVLLGLVVVLALHDGGGSVRGAQPRSGPAAALEGAALPLGGPAPSFTLTDQGGRAVSLSASEGKLTVLSFLYSRCGAPCIVIAQQIRGALDELARPVRVLIVSADPAGDSRASVRRFLA